MKLKTSKPKKRNPIIIIIGEHGIGKSTFGRDSVDPLFILTEDGVSNLEGVDVVEIKSSDNNVCQTYGDFVDALDRVLKEDHDYKTLVIDTFNGVSSLLAKHVCETKYNGVWAATRGTSAFMSYGEGYKACAEMMRAAMRTIEKINTERGMTIILTTHLGLHNVSNPRLGEYQRIEGDMDKSIWKVVSNWADLVLLAEFEMTVLRDKKRAESTNVRILRCGGSVSEDTKMRAGFEVPEVMPLSFDVFWENLKNTDKNVSERILQLWPHLPKEKQDSALQWLGVKTIDEVGTVTFDRARVLLNSIIKLVGDSYETNNEIEEEQEKE